jgi:hypothetical protein
VWSNSDELLLQNAASQYNGLIIITERFKTVKCINTKDFYSYLFVRYLSAQARCYIDNNYLSAKIPCMINNYHLLYWNIIKKKKLTMIKDILIIL